MSTTKELSIEDLLSILWRAPGEIDDKDQYAEFVDDVVEVVIKHFGGALVGVSFNDPEEEVATITIAQNEELPGGGDDWGIYKGYGGGSYDEEDDE